MIDMPVVTPQRREVPSPALAKRRRVDRLPRCGVVIPCLNEAAAVGPLVQAVRQHLDTVLVVDDGSVDGTAQVAAAAGAVVLRHERPLGKGAALRTGLGWMHAHQFTWALLMDGDGQHAPDDVPSFLRRARQSEVSLVVGNRMADVARMPWMRRVANHWMSRSLSRLSGWPLPDSQCGFRLLQVPVWASLDISTKHFEIESEMLLAFLEAGQRVEFVPIRVIYGAERTKIRPLLDAWRWSVWRWRARRRR